MLLRWITRSLWPRIWAAANKWLEDDGPTWAASLGYYAVFSFFPVVLVLLSGVGFVLKFSPQTDLRPSQFVKLIGQQTSPQLADQIGKLLNSFLSGVESKASGGGAVGLVVLVFAAIGVFTQLEAAFGRIWNVYADPHRKTGIWAATKNALFVRLRAFLMLLATGALVLVAFVATTVITAVGHRFDEMPFGLGPTLLRVTSIGVGGVC